MARLLFLLGVVAVIIILINWLFRQPPKVHWQLIATVVAIVLLLLVITGRAHWITAVFAAMLPFLRALVPLLTNLPLLKRILAGIGAAKAKSQPTGGQTSSVQSKYVRMTLAHDSGEMDGEILEGPFKGRKLSELGLEDLLQLLQECQQDEESVALVQAYLDRVHGDEWRQQAGAEEQNRAADKPDQMTKDEALEILGLSPGASEKEIIEAHRRLMQKLHPDRGGSAYLAATINLAKKTLLED